MVCVLIGSGKNLLYKLPFGFPVGKNTVLMPKNQIPWSKMGPRNKTPTTNPMSHSQALVLPILGLGV